MELTKGDYEYRIKRNNESIYCSVECKNKGLVQKDERKIQLTCNNCKKDFTNDLDKYRYRQTLKKLEEGKRLYCSVYCSNLQRNQSDFMRQRITETQKEVSCPQRGIKGRIMSDETKHKISESRKELFQKQGNESSRIELTCKNKNCGKKFMKERWIYNQHVKKYGDNGMCCSPDCYHEIMKGKSRSEETKQKASLAQMGISKPTVGRIGHVVTEETRLKISGSKTGVSVKPDWDIVVDELRRRGIPKYVITRAPVPDAIWVDGDGRLIALELEKKPIFAVVNMKMESYIKSNLQHHNGYDKVILVWRNLEGKFMGEWHFENNKWTKIS